MTCFRRAAFDIEIEGLEERPWTRPDADPSDYFNYGMVLESLSLRVDFFGAKENGKRVSAETSPFSFGKREVRPPPFCFSRKTCSRRVRCVRAHSKYVAPNPRQVENEWRVYQKRQLLVRRELQRQARPRPSKKDTSR